MFTGETKVLTVGLTTSLINDLVLLDGTFGVWACDDAGDWVTARASVQMVKPISKLVGLIFKNGELVIRCAPEQELRLYDKSWKAAQDLVAGDRVLSFIYREGGYVEIEMVNHLSAVNHLHHEGGGITKWERTQGPTVTLAELS